MNNKLYFTTMNDAGEEFEWNYATPDDFEDKYWNCEGIPEDMNDTVTYCEFAGKELYFNTFEDLVMVFIGACD